MKVLVLAYAYPPFPIVGSIRPSKLVAKLLKAGHQVHVLTARLPGEKARYRQRAAGLTVETVATWPNPKALYRWIKRKRGRDPVRGGDDATPDAATIQRWSAPRTLPVLKRLILSALQTPDDLQGFIVPAAIRGLQAFATGPDLVYSTSPPPSSHLAALLVKGASGARWVAEFRDPWLGNEAMDAAGRIRSAPTDALNARLEQLCLRRANRVVAVTRRASDIIASRLDLEKSGLIILARNGIDTLRPLRPPSRRPPFSVVYLGEIGGGRDPRPFLRGVADLILQRGLREGDLSVDLVGNCKVYHDLDLEEEVDRLALSAFVRFRDWVDHKTAMEILDGADLLLLLAQRQRAQVPNKLYEYLGFARPILAFVDEDGESAELLREAGGHFLVSEKDHWNALPALEGALDSFLTGDGFQGGTPNRERLMEWSSDRQFDHLLRCLGLH